MNDKSEKRNKILTFDELENCNRISDGILPSPAILESYEEISPGFVEKMITVIKKEQDHRHQFEQNQLKSYQETLKFSKFIIVCSIVGSIFVVGEIPTMCLYFFTFILVLIMSIRSHKAYQRASLNLEQNVVEKEDKQEQQQDQESEVVYQRKKRRRNRRRNSGNFGVN